MTNKINSLRGMPDFYPEDIISWTPVENKLEEIFNSYSINEIRTPIMEYTDLYKRSVGDTSDIVNKEIYSFNDRNDQSLSLRPEGTAGVIRSIIEKKLDQQQSKFWYMGPMFRYERPQKGRYRQFHQAGIELLGFEEGKADFELISMICSIINGLKIKNTTLKINHLGDKQSKQDFAKELVSFLSSYKDQMDEKDLERLNTNPLRILDTKDHNIQEILKSGPSLKDFIPNSANELLENIQSTFGDLCNIEIDNNLVRGLDYYTGLVFEATSSDLGAQDAFLGGGRYDILSEMLGGKDMPAIGLAIGLERIISIATISPSNKKKVAFITSTSNIAPLAFKIANQLRSANSEISLDMDLTESSIKAKLRRANKTNASHVFILGDEEINNNLIIVKYLREDVEQTNVSLKELIELYKEI
ncbi:histidine--tRNA ligase [Gammaproteobacteria bacterium]|jgi:histidyl-tRNA synthetase|nr:histidine--tRNA ligase [Gammaproteobacteria bacterium]MDC1491573.1 histidine--tRNA ligase [Gammaproteobacteria bacterium]|tara:strand:+ start:466 stop:1713 length:1248 start_codon:yes stop_codon:yes gene_type:complete